MSGIHQRIPTPGPSPLSSYTPILRSPISPYIHPPIIRPILYASPGKSTSNFPAAGSLHPSLSSPSSYR
ncbi:hypothetical protein U1Q18_041698, partial [Sarracenia purpurea var. burkii]